MSSARDRDTAPLLDVVRQRIAEQGPVPVHDYVRLCLEHPLHGYWQRAHTLGRSGDFITAPEISQVFGELIGIWLIVAWQALGQPAPLRLVELGPGRGTLMRDALRATRIARGFLEAATLHLVEISESLRLKQQHALSDLQMPKAWHDGLHQVPDGAAIVIGNEFLDALPVRQLISCNGAWHERMIAVGPNGVLQFQTGPHADDLQIENASTSGTVLELRPGEDALLDLLGKRSTPFLSLFIDYGPAAPAYGDTLQAVRGHAYADPLSEPGTADLTAHVQFGHLAGKAKARGLAAHGPITQTEFLGSLGIVERAGRLMTANPGCAGEIEAAVQRLISPSGMGSLFKVLLISSPGLPPPVPFG